MKTAASIILNDRYSAVVRVKSFEYKGLGRFKSLEEAELIWNLGEQYPGWTITKIVMSQCIEQLLQKLEFAKLADLDKVEIHFQIIWTVHKKVESTIRTRLDIRILDVSEELQRDYNALGRIFGENLAFVHEQLVSQRTKENIWTIAW